MVSLREKLVDPGSIARRSSPRKLQILARDVEVRIDRVASWNMVETDFAPLCYVGVSNVPSPSIKVDGQDTSVVLLNEDGVCSKPPGV